MHKPWDCRSNADALLLVVVCDWMSWNLLFVAITRTTLWHKYYVSVDILIEEAHMSQQGGRHDGIAQATTK